MFYNNLSDDEHCFDVLHDILKKRQNATDTSVVAGGDLTITRTTCRGQCDPKHDGVYSTPDSRMRDLYPRLQMIQ